MCVCNQGRGWGFGFVSAGLRREGKRLRPAGIGPARGNGRVGDRAGPRASEGADRFPVGEVTASLFRRWRRGRWGCGGDGSGRLDGGVVGLRLGGGG
ncbi:hypothetical protein M8C21_009196 [Ambrosia artemisiifolia]|uniref:Uncharacterized protein n=1 Tax=Ambrosia artemisiifolia TaxID=4212 RepID=A0AAD5D8B8_AMBAR|nr:hypothetical protein M8C21_009196 [Ambrosia artemisiifolia]